LGGWLTDNWSWRWTFYINLPVGIIAIFLMFLLLEDPPYIRANRGKAFDRIGFGLIALFLGTLQIILDKGQDDDWFGAIWLRWFTVICILSLIGFIAYELHIAHPLVDLRVFKNRNFRVSCILFALFGLTLYALLAIQPLFLQSLLGYNAFKSGLSVCPRGIGSFAALFFVGVLASKVDSPLLTVLGFAFIGISSFLLCRLTLQISMSCLMLPNIVAGFGTGCLFVPLTTLAVGTLRNEQIGNAIGLQNLVRNIGGSVGLALVSTFQQRLALAHQNFLVAQLSPLNLQYQQRLAAVQNIFAQRFNPSDALAHAQGLLYNRMIQQSNYWSFMDVFFLVACACAASLFFVPLFAKPHAGHAVMAGE
jgi:DHA2 family multidrug resistance protein